MLCSELKQTIKHYYNIRKNLVLHTLLMGGEWIVAAGQGESSGSSVTVLLLRDPQIPTYETQYTTHKLYLHYLSLKECL